MAFTTITLMNMVRGPLTTISWILNSVFVDGKTSVDRLSRFMLVDSIENYVEMTPYRADRLAVELKDLTIQHPTPVEPVFDAAEERKKVTDVFCLLCCPKWAYKIFKKVQPFYANHWSFACIPCPCKKKKKENPWAGMGGGRGGGRGGGGRGGGRGGGGRGGGGRGGGGDDGKEKDADVNRGPCVVNANLTVAHGSLTCIVGKVGSGKSSLLLSLMGEIDRLQGSVTLSGTVSYAAQSACVLNATVRENILYGNP